MVNNATRMKRVQMIEPQVIKDNASWTSAELDTIGAARASIYFRVGATDIAMAALKLQECDTSGGSFTDVSGGDYSAALPSATDDNKTWAWHVRCGGNRLRFLKLVATAGDGTAGTYGVSEAFLSGLEETPNSASERGVSGAEVFI